MEEEERRLGEMRSQGGSWNRNLERFLTVERTKGSSSSVHPCLHLSVRFKKKKEAGE